MTRGGRQSKQHTIKDIVHSYVDFDDRERRLIDSPWCQRLKRVRQNDVSCSVYPSMLGTRFEHSLGVMHMAGRCMRAAMDASESEHKTTFLEQLERDLAPDSLPAPAGDSVQEIAYRLARLYGLLHDIGHPPFSHLMESCLGIGQIYRDPPAGGAPKWLKKRHELNGHEIVDKHLDGDDLLPVIARLMKGRLADRPALRAIKSLVDSVIDADRMDFVLRDGITSGGEFGHYSHDRLVKSFRISVDRLPTGAIREIYIRPGTAGLSALESLLQERYKIYRWVHFHPRVVMTTALFRHALRELTRLSVVEPGWFRAANYYSS